MSGDHQAIRNRAYALWEREGRPDGRSLDHRPRAEAEFAPAPPPGIMDDRKPDRPPVLDRAGKAHDIEPPTYPSTETDGRCIAMPRRTRSNRKLVVGNWKMNGLVADVCGLAGELAQRLRGVSCEVVVCPPATLIMQVAAALAGSGIAIGGQDCHQAEKGPYTGDMSAEMLRDSGCRYVLVGHAERRWGHNETNQQAGFKVRAAWRAGLIPILCVGETGSQREAGPSTAEKFVRSQLQDAAAVYGAPDILIVAYEPVWAIGSGSVPTIADVVAMHKAIRAMVPLDTRILYGGSVRSFNVAELLHLDEVDGVLVGAASLSPPDFCAIVAACS